MFNINSLDNAIERLQKYSHYGEGIVILGGGVNYFINAYLNVKLLRFLGCKLPIEWFYITGELNDKQFNIVSDFEDVELRELKNLPQLTGNFAREGGGWQSKFFAILQSSFSQLIYLDSDCFAQIDPTFLLECDEFKRYGIMTWYDGFRWDQYKEWFNKDFEELVKLFPEVSFNTVRTFETGQMVLNKDKIGNVLYYATELNRWWHQTFKLMLGDKETLYLGCEHYGIPYFVIPRFPGVVDKAFIQYAPDCTTHLFSHCFASKWNKSCRCLTSSRILPHARDMELWCHELIKKIW